MFNMETNIELKIINNRIKIYINSSVHLVIKYDEFIGFQSWVGDNSRYFIEYYTLTNTFYCEYDSIIKWKKILNLLDEKI